MKSMLKSEWGHLVDHKILLIVFFVIAWVPTIYAVLFLASMWNLYGQMKNLPVAVTNQDQAVFYQNKRLAIGADLERNLKKSKSLDYHFVSQKQADQGLKNGEYYMALTIPANFSQSATTLLDKHPKIMELKYKTSAGHNFTASKFAASAVTSMRDSVSAQITKTYSETIFQELKTVGTGMSKAAAGSKKLADGSRQAASGNGALTTYLKKLASGTLTFQDGATTLKQGLQKYIAGVDKVNQGVQTLNSKTPILADGTNRLNDGASKLVQNGSRLTNGSMALTSGLSQLNGQTPALASGISRIAKGSRQLQSGLSTLDGKINSPQTKAQLTQLSDGLNQMKSGISALDNQVNDPQTARQVKQLSSLVSELQNGLSSISQQSDANDESLVKIIETIPDGTLKSSLTQVQQNQIAINQRIDQMNRQMSSTDLSKFNSILSQLQQGVTALYNGYNGTNATAGLYQGTNSVISSLRQVGSAVNNPGSSSLLGGAAQLADGLTQLHGKMPALTNGVNALQSGATQLSSGTRTYVNGVGALAGGIGQLNSRIPALTSGINQLADGTGQLQQSGPALTYGTGQLASGASKLNNGAGQLAQGANKLGTALNKISTGTAQLSSQLGKGSNKISEIKPTNATYQMMAMPVKAEQHEMAEVPNNGTGMAPYMLSLALFVGTMILNFVYDIYRPRRMPESGFSWWISKISILETFAFLQVTLMFILTIAVDGLDPLSAWKTYGVLLLASFAFLSIVSFFNLWLGKLGAFLMLIFMMIQLGGSAGTYPIQLSNGFFRAIHPWLPLSWSVSALRQTISIGGSVLPNVVWLAAAAIIFNILMILYFARRDDRFSEIDFDDEKAVRSTKSLLVNLAMNRKTDSD